MCHSVSLLPISFFLEDSGQLFHSWYESMEHYNAFRLNVYNVEFAQFLYDAFCVLIAMTGY